jgi:hypothetical protein
MLHLVGCTLEICPAYTESAVDNKAVQYIVVVINYTVETWTVMSINYIYR